jgi:hypothetical protein
MLKSQTNELEIFFKLTWQIVSSRQGRQNCISFHLKTHATCPQEVAQSIGPRLMKRRSLVRIPPPPSCVDISKKKKKKKPLPH